VTGAVAVFCVDARVEVVAGLVSCMRWLRISRVGQLVRRAEQAGARPQSEPPAARP